MDTLDQWQAEAIEGIKPFKIPAIVAKTFGAPDEETEIPKLYHVYNKRIFALIELVRAKDLALNRIATSYSTFKPPSEIASEALALTDELK